jgi:hypothetical protein
MLVNLMPKSNDVLFAEITIGFANVLHYQLPSGVCIAVAIIFLECRRIFHAADD